MSNKYYLYCNPAYGRKYKTLADAQKDWEAGLDFRQVEWGYYFSIRDARTIQDNAYDGVYLVGFGELKTDPKLVRPMHKAKLAENYSGNTMWDSLVELHNETKLGKTVSFKLEDQKWANL